MDNFIRLLSTIRGLAGANYFILFLSLIPLSHLTKTSLTHRHANYCAFPLVYCNPNDFNKGN
jgi:hypothetical protein